MSKSKEFIGATLAAVALASATPNFEVSKANAQVNRVPLVDCESTDGIKKNYAIVMLGKDRSIEITDGSKHYQLTNEEKGIRVDAREEGERGSASILVGDSPILSGRQGEIYITSGKRSLPLEGKTVNVRTGEGNENGRATYIDVFCDPKSGIK